MSDFIRFSDSRDYEKRMRNVVCCFFCIGRRRNVTMQEHEIKINLKRAGMLDRIGFSCS